MPDHKYRRTVDELHEHASLFWPEELSQKAATLSVIPKLLETQDQFIAILSLRVRDLESLFSVIQSSELSANLFLKHLVVLSDFGGEMLQRVNSEFSSFFPNREMIYLWNGEERTYRFKALPVKALTNARLGISGKRLLAPMPLNELHQDVIALLLLGGASIDETVAQWLERCEVSAYLGKPDELTKFIKQRYIWVSRITGGARSNTLGQLAENYVAEYLQECLGAEGITVRQNGTLPGISHRDPETGRLTTFDIVVSGGGRHAAVEVSFQVTTNSVIERKSREARNRFEQVERAGYKIAYVIDGAGNFQRVSAVGTICEHSHCTVAFSKPEFDLLCEFLTAYFTASP